MFNFLKKIISPFSKLKWALGTKLRSLFAKAPGPEAFEELERLFYEADLGAKVSLELVQDLQKQAKIDPNPEHFLPFIKDKLLKIFPPRSEKAFSAPHVILIVGVNGSGKTTSLIKLAHHYEQNGKKVLIAAGDTFRAAAVDQLQTWSERLKIPLIKSQSGSDPAAVVFDAISAAKAREVDIVLIDTAGRLQTKKDLMQELAKIRKICGAQIAESPHETLLVLDSTLGQNSLDQARTFHEFTPLTGIILTKLDGSAKGGIAVAIQKELQIPILWVTTGEGPKELYPFDPESYIDALLK